MSYTELAAAFENGELHGEHEFRNSHGSAAFIWDVLVRKYEIGADDLGRWEHGFPPMDAPERLWKYHQDGGRLTSWEKNALETTYDNTVVKRDDMLTVAASFRRMENAFCNGKRVCSLAAQAKVIVELHEKGALFLAWHQTSVGDCWYVTCTDEESRYYNVLTGTDHRVAPILAIEAFW